MHRSVLQSPIIPRHRVSLYLLAAVFIAVAVLAGAAGANTPQSPALHFTSAKVCPSATARVLWKASDPASQPLMTHRFKQIFRRIMRPKSLELPQLSLSRQAGNVNPRAVPVVPRSDCGAVAKTLPLLI
jgi:hypothetical protein